MINMNTNTTNSMTAYTASPYLKSLLLNIIISILIASLLSQSNAHSFEAAAICIAWRKRCNFKMSSASQLCHKHTAIKEQPITCVCKGCKFCSWKSSKDHPVCNSTAIRKYCPIAFAANDISNSPNLPSIPRPARSLIPPTPTMSSFEASAICVSKDKKCTTVLSDRSKVCKKYTYVADQPVECIRMACKYCSRESSCGHGACKSWGIKTWCSRFHVFSADDLYSVNRRKKGSGVSSIISGTKDEFGSKAEFESEDGSSFEWNESILMKLMRALNASLFSAFSNLSLSYFNPFLTNL